jgi:hypothetical protein
MTTIRFLAAHGITLCLTLGMISISCKNETSGSGPFEDEPWAVIEYPAGQEVIIELKPTAAAPPACPEIRRK